MVRQSQAQSAVLSAEALAKEEALAKVGRDYASPDESGLWLAPATEGSPYGRPDHGIAHCKLCHPANRFYGSSIIPSSRAEVVPGKRRLDCHPFEVAACDAEGIPGVVGHPEQPKGV